MNQNQTVRGTARDIKWHKEELVPQEASSVNSNLDRQVLTFNIEQVDRVGNILGYVPVELRLWQIKNVLVDGDEVEIVGDFRTDKILVARKVTNLRTRATVSSDESYISTGPDRSFWGGGFARNVKWKTGMWLSLFSDEVQLSFTLVQQDYSGNSISHITIVKRRMKTLAGIAGSIVGVLFCLIIFFVYPIVLVVATNEFLDASHKIFLSILSLGLILFAFFVTCPLLYNFLFVSFVKPIVVNGNEVEVKGKILRNGVVAADEVMNISTRRKLT